MAFDEIMDVPVHRAKADAGGIALVEGADARRVIAAEAVAHHRDALGIDLRPRGDVVVGRDAGGLVVVACRDIAEPQRLGLAGPVDRERVDAALGEIEPGEDHAHLLGVVHAVEQHHGRPLAEAAAFDEPGRQALALVGHFDALDVGMKPRHRALVAAQRLAIHRKLVVARRDEALGAVVVVAGAHVLVAGSDGVARGVGLVADPGDAVGLARPFLHPSAVEIGLARACLQPLRDQVDLGHRRGAIGHHALDDLGGVAPAQVSREGDRPVAFGRHRNHDKPSCCTGRH